MKKSKKKAKTSAWNYAPSYKGKNNTRTVFSHERNGDVVEINLHNRLELNKRLKMDGIELMRLVHDSSIPVAFLDPQYRNVLDNMGYGNEGKDRGRTRSDLPQMDNKTISSFIKEIDRLLVPSGHLFLWLDKFELLNGFQSWMKGTDLGIVDMVNWDKIKMGMGYRSRRVTEHCVVLQKSPRKVKGVWKSHDLRDTWREAVSVKKHPHRKPVGLQGALLSAVTNEGDVVLDPCAGDFTVLEAALLKKRNFLGGDING